MENRKMKYIIWFNTTLFINEDILGLALKEKIIEIALSNFHPSQYNCERINCLGFGAGADIELHPNERSLKATVGTLKWTCRKRHKGEPCKGNCLKEDTMIVYIYINRDLIRVAPKAHANFMKNGKGDLATLNPGLADFSIKFALHRKFHIARVMAYVENPGKGHIYMYDKTIRYVLTTYYNRSKHFFWEKMNQFN